MNKTLKAVLLTVTACALVFGGVTVGMNYEKWFGDAPAARPASYGPKLELDPNAGEYVAPVVTPDPYAGGIAIPGWGSITIPSGKTEVTVDFPNPEANMDRYYLSFELRLKETGEVLYTSGLVEPSLHIQTITLNREMEKGTYQAVIRVQPYKMDENQTPTNNADMETNLIVV